MKYILSIIITFVTLLSAQELPGWSIYFGAGIGSAIYDDDYIDGYDIDIASKTPIFGFSKGLNARCPFNFKRRFWKEKLERNDIGLAMVN